jgi:hypothetical protein
LSLPEAESKAADLPTLASALGVDSDLLDALEARFRREAADKLEDFLKNHEIPCAFWNRIGD